MSDRSDAPSVRFTDSWVFVSEIGSRVLVGGCDGGRDAHKLAALANETISISGGTWSL
jgi:hypothetical protein